MHKRLTITAYVCLATYLPLFAIAGPAAKQQAAQSKEAADQDATDKKSSDAESAPKKSSGRSKATKKKTGRVSSAKKTLERASSTKKVPERDTGLAMEPGVVCESLVGYEDYKPLRGAAQTAEEKLLVYIRPFGFQTEKVDAGHQAHLTADGEIRKARREGHPPPEEEAPRVQARDADSAEFHLLEELHLAQRAYPRRL